VTISPWAEVGFRVLVPTPVAATIGVFDGVHRGHQRLLEEVCRGPDPSASLVVTFRDNPKKLFQRRHLGDLMTWEEKVSALSDLGVGHVVVIDFSPTFSRMSGRDFFLTLKKSFVFSKLVLGWDFSFGKDSSTGAADLGWLAEPETRLTVLPPFELDGTGVSSSASPKGTWSGPGPFSVGPTLFPWNLPSDGTTACAASPVLRWESSCRRRVRIPCAWTVKGPSLTLRMIVLPGSLPRGYVIERLCLYKEYTMALSKEEKAKIVADFGGAAANTGSTEVQIALITARIQYLTGHFKTEKKDHNSRRGLLQLVGQRRRLLRYLQTTNLAGYRALIEKLGLRK
jgi:small subunit ribosomal protein S15